MDTGGRGEIGSGAAGVMGHPHCGQTCTESVISAPHSWQCRILVEDTGHPQIGQVAEHEGISVPHSLQKAPCPSSFSSV